MATGDLLVDPNLPIAQSLSDLHDRLDQLWTDYLHHLDQYASAQRLLQKHMSASFLSLARANFSNRNAVGRYGKDLYHENPVALHRVKIASAEQGGRSTMEVVTMDSPVPASDDEKLAHEEPSQQPSPPATPAQQSDEAAGPHISEKANDGEPFGAIDNDKVDESSSSTTDKAASGRLPLSMDSLRWFGVLVPPDLRSAQTSFTSAIQDPVIQAVDAARAMRDAEFEIRKIRKQIRKVEKLDG